MATRAHRQSISKRSSATGVEKNNGGKSSVWRLQYLNDRFNKDSKFEIEVGETEEGVTRASNEELAKLDLAVLEKSLLEMGVALESSIDLLVPIFKYLDKFEGDLEKLSNEMQVLQERLVQLNEEIAENGKIDAEISPVLIDLLIPPKCIEVLVSDSLDAAWVEQMTILQEKKEVLASYEGKSSENVEEMMKLIEKLELKCVERIKVFIVDSIRRLRDVRASSVKVQSRMLRVRSVVPFLKGRNSGLLVELRTAYVYTMRWYYYFNFVKYISSLEHLNLYECNLANDARSYNTSTMNEYLINLPKRFELSNEEGKYSVPAQIAESAQGNVKFFMEQAIAFLNQSIVDNITLETSFVTEFFGVEGEELTEMIGTIFKPVLKMGVNFSKYVMEKCNGDYFGILFAIRRLQKLERETQTRLLPEVVDKYVANQLMLLWPEFQRCMDRLNAGLASGLASTGLLKSVVSGSANVMIPLPVTQMFSTVVAGLLQLATSYGNETGEEGADPLCVSVDRLSGVYEKGILQVAASLDKSRQSVFIEVNIQHVVAVLEGTGTGGGKTLVEHFEKVLENRG